MIYTRISAEEAAAMIQNDETVALSGFTPNGVAKAVFRELSKRARREHEAGHPFKVGIITGASTGQSVEGDMAAANAIKFRTPFSTNKDFREHVNAGEIDFEDMHLGHVAERLRRGFYGEIDGAIIEVSGFMQAGSKYRGYLTSAGGVVPTIVRMAKHVILELNTFHSPQSRLLHDVYEPARCPHRLPIMINHVCDRIGREFVEIDGDKIVGVVECCIPEEARSFKPVDEVTQKMGILWLISWSPTSREGFFPRSSCLFRVVLASSVMPFWRRWAIILPFLISQFTRKLCRMQSSIT